MERLKNEQPREAPAKVEVNPLNPLHHLNPLNPPNPLNHLNHLHPLNPLNPLKQTFNPIQPLNPRNPEFRVEGWKPKISMHISPVLLTPTQTLLGGSRDLLTNYNCTYNPLTSPLSKYSYYGVHKYHEPPSNVLLGSPFDLASRVVQMGYGDPNTVSKGHQVNSKKTC